VKASTVPGRFVGFSQKSLKFLKDLAANNEREWFQANRDTYDREVKTQMANLVIALSTEFKSRKLEIVAHPDQSIFRINRDVRFSKNKSPYKTHIGAAMTRDGSKKTPGVIYIHIEPAGSFSACGFYQPEAEVLDCMRKKIAAEPKKFIKLVDLLEKKDLPLEAFDSLKRLPRGFEGIENEEIQPFLKFKSFIVRHPLSKSMLADGKQLVREIVAFVEASYPLLRFGWSAIDDTKFSI
jgi:uncharacterized protein (TIGR02453 family)